MRNKWWILIFLLLSGVCQAQEINFSRIQDMTLWYNQSLKTDKLNSMVLNYRNIQYNGQIAYNSIAAMFDMPLLSRAARDKANSGYFSVSMGAASDKSNQGILNNTSGLLGIAYAVPVSSRETYLSLGFQAAYFQSQLNISNTTAPFGDQYDAYGPIEGQPSNDRLAAGWSYGHFNFNTGVSLFKNEKNVKWYLGASLQQLNQPYTDKAKSPEFRLKPALGIQGGYKYVTDNSDEVAFYMSMNWQGPAYKHFYNASYVKALPSVPGGAVGFGLGYRYNDALVPNIELRYQKMILGISYDVNISSLSAAGAERNGVELGIRIDY